MEEHRALKLWPWKTKLLSHFQGHTFSTLLHESCSSKTAKYSFKCRRPDTKYVLPSMCIHFTRVLSQNSRAEDSTQRERIGKQCELKGQCDPHSADKKTFTSRKNQRLHSEYFTCFVVDLGPIVCSLLLTQHPPGPGLNPDSFWVAASKSNIKE